MQAKKNGATPPSLADVLFSYGESSSNPRASRACSDASDSLSMLRGALRRTGPRSITASAATTASGVPQLTAISATASRAARERMRSRSTAAAVSAARRVPKLTATSAAASGAA